MEMCIARMSGISLTPPCAPQIAGFDTPKSIGYSTTDLEEIALFLVETSAWVVEQRAWMAKKRMFLDELK